MKFGIREICDVVLKAKTAQKVGNRVFYKNEPVLYFDSLKTSSLEGASTTVYAQGGRGNARLIAWEGERTVTFTMEDALISPEGFSILTGAGLVQGEEKPIIMHTTEQTDAVYTTTSGSGSSATIAAVEIVLSNEPHLGDQNVGTESTETIALTSSSFAEAVSKYDIFNGNTKVAPNEEYNSTATYSIKTKTFTMNPSEDFIYVMHMTDGLIDSEPYIPSEVTLTMKNGKYSVVKIFSNEGDTQSDDYIWPEHISTGNRKNDLSIFHTGDVVFVDYYTARTTGAYQVNITPDKFGGNYYLEASTLFRDTNGTDLPAEFVIPNCKIQSNFTFSMAASGDPSTFTFTMDAFPDYTRWDKTKKVFAAIQVFDVGKIGADLDRLGTGHDNTNVLNDYTTNHKPFIEL